MMNHFILYMIVLVLESFVDGAGGGGGPTDNFRMSSRSKVFCNSTEFFTDEFNFFLEGGGGHGPLDFFVAFRSESFIVFHIIHKTVVKNMCRK